MWRATVIERIADGQVVVSIPSLFRGDPVGPMQSAVDAQVGDAVIVADLRPAAKVRDWWVMGYESQVGRWGSPYPHEHPIGQVTGLVDALGTKADTSALSAYAPTAWTDCSVSTYLTKETGSNIQVRNTPLGVQIRSGRWRIAASVPLDSVMFTLPTGFAPAVPTFFSVPGMSSASTGYLALTIHLEFRATGSVTLRQAITNGPLFTLNHIIHIP